MKRLIINALLFLVVCIVVPAGAHAQYHITPTGTGDGSGTSFENSATLADLPRLTAALNGIGGDITIYPGTYTNVIAWIAGSGTTTNPIIIHGQSSNNPDFMATIDGFGSNFLFTNAVANVHLTDLKFTNCDLCIQTYSTVSNITIQDILAENVNRFFESGVQNNEPVVGNGWLFTNIKVEGHESSAFRFVADRNGGSIRNLTLDRIFVQANPADYNPGAATFGAIEFRGDVSDVTVRRTTLMNRVDNVGQTTQPNTDGFWAGPGTRGISISDSFVAGYTDGGLDLSSDNATLTRVTSVANRANVILTQGIPDAFIISNIISMNPSDTHIQATDSDVDTIIARVTGGLFQTGPAIVNPNVGTGAWIVDSYRCAIVMFEGGVVNHGDGTQRTRVNANGGCPGSEKGVFTNVELGPQPEQVVMPVVPDNTTVGRTLIGDEGEGEFLRRSLRKHLPFGFLWYAIASVLYIMIIHFAFAIRKQFDVFQIAGIFIFGALIGWFFQRYEIGFIMAIIMSLLFW